MTEKFQTAHITMRQTSLQNFLYFFKFFFFFLRNILFILCYLKFCKRKTTDACAQSVFNAQVAVTNGQNNCESLPSIIQGQKTQDHKSNVEGKRGDRAEGKHSKSYKCSDLKYRELLFFFAFLRKAVPVISEFSSQQRIVRCLGGNIDENHL